MSFLNLEIKARCSSPDLVRRVLKERKATFKGVDCQVDTYFNVPRGRLKLRKGSIENSLIHYCREDEVGPKKSIVTLYHPAENSTLKEILTNSLGVLVVVEKVREIYFIENVKFHIDTVDRLGTFVEIEAIDSTGAIGEETLQKQCEEYINLFGIRAQDLIDHSYSDMILHPEAQPFSETRPI
jgi:predicted adenylyl cyclase CyaB